MCCLVKTALPVSKTISTSTVFKVSNQIFQESLIRDGSLGFGNAESVHDVIIGFYLFSIVCSAQYVLWFHGSIVSTISLSFGCIFAEYDAEL